VRNLRIAAVVVVVGGLVLAHHLGAFEHLRDPACLQRKLVELGPWGWLAFVGAFAVFQPFGVPGMVFILASSVIWPWPTAFGLSMIGTMIATSVGFGFSRFVARDWVSGIIPARFKKYEDALERRAFATIVVLRTFFMMQPMLHAFFGVSKVRFSTHFWASFFGYLAPVFLWVFFGQKLFDALKDAPPSVWIGIGAAILTVSAVFLVVRRARANAVPE
jgi:uncharacterized membrane protein YdjX (TVP38/TMEM64 family)